MEKGTYPATINGKTVTVKIKGTLYKLTTNPYLWVNGNHDCRFEVYSKNRMFVFLGWEPFRVQAIEEN